MGLAARGKSDNLALLRRDVRAELDDLRAEVNSRLAPSRLAVTLGLSLGGGGTGGGGVLAPHAATHAEGGGDTLLDNSITNKMLRDSGPLSVIGRPVFSSGDPSDITAALNISILSRDGTALGFRTVAQMLPLGFFPFANPITLTISGAIAGGAANTFARSDHHHSVSQNTNRMLGRLTAGFGLVEELTAAQVGGWLVGGVVDHGGLGGLGDDDHTQYLLANGTRALTGNWAVGNFDITGVDDFSAKAATLTGTGILTLHLSGANPQFQMGSGAGATSMGWLKNDADESFNAYYSAGQPRWQYPYIPTDESARVLRYTSAGVGLNYSIWFTPGDTVAATQTVYQDRTHHWSDDALYAVYGSTGSVVSERRKADASQASDQWGIVGSIRWIGWMFNTDESFHNRRINTDGSTTVNNPLHHNHTNTLSATVTTLADATINFSYPTVLHTLGTGSGTPRSVYDKLGTGEAWIEWKNESIRRWINPYLDTSEALGTLRYTDAAAFIAYALRMQPSNTQAGASTELHDATVSLLYPNATLAIGDGTGGTIDVRRKADASTAYSGFQKVGTDWWLWEFGTTEYLGLQRRGAGGFVNYLIHGNDSATVAAAVTTLDDGQVYLSRPNAIETIGDGTGSPVRQAQKSDGGTYIEEIKSNALTRFRRQMDTAEDIFDRRFTTGGAIETEVGYLASGYLRITDYWAVSDAITAPSSVASFAKFYLDSGKNGRPQLLEADGAREQVGIGVDSQAMPVCDRETTDLTVNDTTTETDIFSYSIPANTLGVTGQLHCEVGGIIHHQGTATLRIRIYLGATTLYDSTTNTLTASGDDDAAFFILVDMGNQNATNDQAGDGFIMISSPATATTGVGDLAGAPGGQVSTPISLGDGAVDTTSAQTFRISVTWSAAAVTNRLVRRNAYATIAATA